MKKPLLSICISVHNTEKYLVRCLDSITSQSYKDYEIVLVNNGSTDNSLAVMEQYMEEHPDVQISIYSQEDRGLAQGRQTGINHAGGEYVTFIDADDYYLGEALETLMTTIQTEQVDIVEMQTLKNGCVIKSPFKGLYSAKEFLNYFFEHPFVTPMLWLRVYKASLFDENTMPKLYTNNEDSFVLPYVLSIAKTIFFVDRPLHLYFTENENGVMNSYNASRADVDFLLRKKTSILHVSEYIESKIGKDTLEKDFPAFQFYKKSMLIAFIFSQPYQVSLSRKLQIIQTECAFSSKKDINIFIRHHLHKNFLNRLIKIFGLTFAYELYHRILWRFK